MLNWFGLGKKSKASPQKVQDEKILRTIKNSIEYVENEFYYEFSRLFSGIDEGKIQPAHVRLYEECKVKVNHDAGRKAAPEGVCKIELELDLGQTDLTPLFLDLWGKKWKKELSKLEDQIFSIKLNPETRHLTQIAEDLQRELNQDFDSFSKVLAFYTLSGQEKPLAEATENEKEKARKERRERMKKWEGN